MDFTVAKEAFSRLLYLSNTIVERRNTMPILANVKLSAEDGRIGIAATDLEISLTGEAEATVKTPGTITVAAKVLYEIIRELPGEDVHISSAKGQRVEIESGQSRFKINATSAEEFPALVGTALKNPISVEAQKLFQMLDKTLFAVSTDETRYNINGVYVESLQSDTDEGILRFIATDGHRLAMIDRPAEGFMLGTNVIIPRKGIQELKKVLEQNEGAAKVGVNEGFFTVQSGSVTIGIRLVDGQFPDYRQVVPTAVKTTISVAKNDLLATIRRVALVTTDRSKTIKLRVTDGNLFLSSSSPEYGEASETLAVEQDGEDVSIGFSAKYLIDLLNAMTESEVVQLRLNGELGPGVFTGSCDELYKCIVMPMRFE